MNVTGDLLALCYHGHIYTTACCSLVVKVSDFGVEFWVLDPSQVMEIMVLDCIHVHFHTGV